MKFRVERDTFKDALSLVASAVPKSGSGVPALAGVLVVLDGSTLTLTGSDLDRTIVTSFDVDGSDNGRIVVPARLLADIAKELPEGAALFEIDDKDESVKITAGRATFDLRAISASEYPKMTGPEGESVEVRTELLLEAFRQVAPAASIDDARPVLTGVLIESNAAEGIRVVATDSYRLAWRDVPGANLLADNQTVLIPSSALRDLIKALGQHETMSVRFDQRNVSFEFGSTRISSRLIEGDFPNYKSLIPDSQSLTFTANRGELIAAVKRVAVMSGDGSNVVFAFTPDGSATVSCKTLDIGESNEDIDGEYKGDPLTIAFAPRYLLDGLNAMTTDSVTLSATDALKPALLRSDDDLDFLYLLMPVRLS